MTVTASTVSFRRYANAFVIPRTEAVASMQEARMISSAVSEYTEGENKARVMVDEEMLDEVERIK